MVKKRGRTVGKIFTIVELTIKKAARARCLVGQPTIMLEQVKRLFKFTLILLMWLTAGSSAWDLVLILLSL